MLVIASLASDPNQAYCYEFVNSWRLAVKVKRVMGLTVGMIGILFIFYMALGAALGFGLNVYGGLSIPVSAALGTVATAFLGQVHLIIAHVSRAAETTERLEGLERAHSATRERMDMVEARTDSVESTLKHELTERRDALVSEMRQLETLIDRLSKSFETKLSETTANDVHPQEDAVLRMVKDALQDGRVDLHLQPIVSLPQRRVAFYEGFTRLRRPDGEGA